MGHTLSGFVGRYENLVQAAQALPGAKVCQLLQGFAILPLSEQIAPGDAPAAGMPAFYRLTAPLVAWVQTQTRGFPLAYIETDYFGGTGTQSAAVWFEGKVVVGPLTTKKPGAINRALQYLGVPAPPLSGRVLTRLGLPQQGGCDEFDVVGLGSCRHNEDLLEDLSS